MLIKELCDINGVSGDEKRVREFIKDKIKAFTDEIITDSIGNLIAFKKGKKEEKTVMLSAHTDEVGFIVSSVTESGYLKFKSVGGIDPRVLISKKVRVGEKGIPGVIGAKAIHLQSASERESVAKIKDLYIDIGAKDKTEAEKYVEIGDYVAFATKSEIIGDNLLKAKAIDDRAGCACLLELIKKDVVYDTYFCFLSQEEVGLRGARVASYRINPDIALVLEATTCSDTEFCEEKDFVTKLGAGVAITFRDAGTIVDDEFRNKLYVLATEKNIPCQYKKTTRGGNDSGAIHLAKGGVKTASLSVPSRYIHSPVSISALSDIEAMKNLADAFLDNIESFV